jgi:hypothetical protein
MSLLTVVSDAMESFGFTAPAAVMASTDSTVISFRSKLRQEGDELSKYHGWRTMKARETLTGDGSTTLFPLPTDYTRFAQGEIMWMEDGLWQTLKLVSDEEMVALQTQDTSLLRPVWRLLGDDIEFYPALDDAQDIVFEYRTNYWVTDSDGLAKARATADSDLFLVPEHLLTLGLIWRFKAEKGFTYDEDFRSYQIARETYVFNDQPRPILRQGRRIFNDGLAAGMVGDVRVIV